MKTRLTFTILIFGTAMILKGVSPITTAVRSIQKWPQESAYQAKFQEDHLIVVDFFAHWCGPSHETTGEVAALEHQWMKTQPAHPVEFLPVNVDKEDPENTIAFLKACGVTQAFRDPGGNLATALEAYGLPHVAILRARRNGSGFQYELVKNYPEPPDRIQLGKDLTALFALEGVQEKEVEIAPEAGTPEIPREALSKLPSKKRFAVESSAEGLFAHSIYLLDFSNQIEMEADDWLFFLTWTRNDFHLDFEPSSRDLGLNERPLSAHRDRIGLQVERTFTPNFTLLLGASHEEGFASHRAVWLGEYYRQQFEGFPEYLGEVQPDGASLNLGGRYHFPNGAGIAEWNLSYQKNKVSPAYERILIPPFTLDRGLDELETVALSGSFQSILNSSMLTRNQLSFSKTTGRDLRLAYSGELRAALGERTILKGELGLTRESNDFHSWSVGLALDYELTNSLTASLFARVYHDSGELIDPTIPSAAAPPLETLRLGAGLTWRRENFAASLAAGFYRTDFDSVPDSSFQYENLYQGRDWGFLQIAASYQF